MIGAVEFEAGNEASWLRKKGVPLFFGFGGRDDMYRHTRIVYNISLCCFSRLFLSLSLLVNIFHLSVCVCWWVSGIV